MAKMIIIHNGSELIVLIITYKNVETRREYQKLQADVYYTLAACLSISTLGVMKVLACVISLLGIWQPRHFS